MRFIDWLRWALCFICKAGSAHTSLHINHFPEIYANIMCVRNPAHSETTYHGARNYGRGAVVFRTLAVDMWSPVGMEVSLENARETRSSSVDYYYWLTRGMHLEAISCGEWGQKPAAEVQSNSRSSYMVLLNWGYLNAFVKRLMDNVLVANLNWVFRLAYIFVAIKIVYDFGKKKE